LCEKLTCWILVSVGTISSHVHNSHIFDIKISVDILSGVKNHTLKHIRCVTFVLDLEFLLLLLKCLILSELLEYKCILNFNFPSFMLYCFQLSKFSFFGNCKLCLIIIFLSLEFHFLFLELNIHFSFSHSFCILKFFSLLFNFEFLLIKCTLMLSNLKSLACIMNPLLGRGLNLGILIFSISFKIFLFNLVIHFCLFALICDISLKFFLFDFECSFILLFLVISISHKLLLLNLVCIFSLFSFILSFSNKALVFDLVFCFSLFSFIFCFSCQLFLSDFIFSVRLFPLEFGISNKLLVFDLIVTFRLFL